MTLVELAKSYAGVGVTSDRARYLSLVRAPVDTLPESYYAAPQTSGCALVARGLWRLSGLEHHILAASYRVGHAISDLVEIARSADAWHAAPLGERRPVPGDAVIIGGPEHVLTVVAVDGDVIHSIDGGQRDARGQQSIAARSRTWRAGTLDGRPILGFVDVAKLLPAEREANTDPEPPGASWTQSIGDVMRSAFLAVGRALTTSEEPAEGIDVSGHQGLVDWRRAAAAGTRFAYVKATEGVDYRDPWSARHAVGAAAAGLDVGVYHYLRVRSGTQDAAEQARQFVESHRELGATLRPAIDVELQNNEGRTAEQVLEAVRAARGVIEDALGVRPLLYTYPAYWLALGSAGRDAVDLAELPLWIAHYTTGQPTVPKPWVEAAMWQYAAGAGVIGHVDGVTGAVDRDRALGGMWALRV